MQADLEEYKWEEAVENAEEAIRMKQNNEYINFPGHCDDWDINLHAMQYDIVCKICGEPFEDGQEFLELECTHVEHTSCIETQSWGQDHTCSTCGTEIIRRWWMTFSLLTIIWILTIYRNPLWDYY